MSTLGRLVGIILTMVLAAGTAAAQLAAQQPPVNPLPSDFSQTSKKAPSSFPKQKGGPLGGPIQKIDKAQPLYLQGDELIYDNKRSLVSARGNVEIYYNNYILTADEVLHRLLGRWLGGREQMETVRPLASGNLLVSGLVSAAFVPAWVAHQYGLALLQGRLHAALAAARADAAVDGERVAAMGFCFGGLCVLDLARSGADVRGVVSFHGLLRKPGNTDDRRIAAKVLVLHGHDDPMVLPADVLAFEQEMTAAGADWQVHAYGHTLHAFTNPEANDPSSGLKFNANANRRSWRSLVNFLEEVLA